MTIQSQCQWAQYLPTYPNTFYLSIVGRISPNIGQVLPPEDVSNSLWLHMIQALYSIWIKLFFYLISVKDMKISQIDCSHWFYFGWDGLVSCYSQLKPSLPSSHHHPSDQSIPAENSILQDMSPGIWHSWELPNDHLRVAMCCNQSWELIWHAVEEMQSSRAHYQAPIKSNTPSFASSLQTTQLPDMQSVPINQLNRDHIAYPITLPEKIIGVGVVLFGLAIVLSDNPVLESIQYFLLPSSLLTFALGNWISHSPSSSADFASTRKWNPDMSFPSASEHFSLFSPFLRSEICMVFANMLRFLSLSLSPVATSDSITTILILTRSLEIATLCALCPHMHEHSSILQLSVSLLVFCCNYFNSFSSLLPHNSSSRLFLTSLLLKEPLHILSKLGWIINSQQQYQEQPMWFWWKTLWVCYLVLSCFSLGPLFSSLSMDSWILFVLLWEWIGSMKEISYSYQVFRLNSSCYSRIDG
jgi:hypothetical protein